jgi:hypothetical protein
VIPEIEIWRAANLMLKQYGDKALEESAARAEELAAQDDHNGAAVWRLITRCRQSACESDAAGTAPLTTRISFRSRIDVRRIPDLLPLPGLAGAFTRTEASRTITARSRIDATAQAVH